jgi:hypothetical protein
MQTDKTEQFRSGTGKTEEPQPAPHPTCPHLQKLSDLHLVDDLAHVLAAFTKGRVRFCLNRGIVSATGGSGRRALHLHKP